MSLVVVGILCGASAFCLVSGLMAITIWCTLSYELSEDCLIIHRTPLRDKRIHYYEIKALTKTDTLLAGPALSLRNRIIIGQNDGSCLVIAPLDLERFIASNEGEVPDTVYLRRLVRRARKRFEKKHWGRANGVWRYSVCRHVNQE